MTTGVSQLLYMLDDAFEGTAWVSLLGNLKTLQADDWLWVPPAGERSVRDIVQHVGGCKFMYEDYAFGEATLTWDDPLVDGGEALESVALAIEWLKKGQARLRKSIATLDDVELERPRMTNWGEPKETRWIIAMMIEHDLYHAGEINHIRSLHRQSDQWAYSGG